LSPNRGYVILLACVLALGAFASARPRELRLAPEHAPTAGIIYAAPLEEIETHVLRRGETLSGLLAAARITGADLTDLIMALRELENPRRMAAGSEVTVRRWAYDGTPRAVELRVDADRTVRLARGASGWTGELRITPTRVDTVHAAGVIHAGRTLYEALVYGDGLDLPPREKAALVTDLAEVYAYKLDFSREIQPGDSYRFVYEREARPDGSSRRRRILAAEIHNRGAAYTAVHFEDDAVGSGYYDAEGKSLRLAFRRYPLDYVRITSAFDWQRYHPVLGIYRAHLGTDFGAPHGTPVKATGDGTVQFAGRDGGYGNIVVIRHPGGYTTHYAHLSRFGKDIARGKRVEQGEVIGFVGATGLATGPHLHYEFRHNGRPLDSRTARLPGQPPIPGDLLASFQRVRDERLALMEAGPGPAFASARSPGRAGGP
jgi:murein DD-endopeptidase MepM/ murein hydrolase activator NlpD